MASFAASCNRAKRREGKISLPLHHEKIPVTNEGTLLSLSTLTAHMIDDLYKSGLSDIMGPKSRGRGCKAGFPARQDSMEPKRSESCGSPPSWLPSVEV